MQLLESWKSSLSLLKPKNLSLFLLVTLNAIIKTYQALFCNFWWALLAYIAFDLGIHYIGSYLGSSSIVLGGIALDLNPSIWILEVGFLLMLFIVLLCARPSLEPHKSDFIAKYWKHFLYFVIINIVFSFMVGARFGFDVDDITGVIVNFIPASFDFTRSLLLLAPAMVVSPLFVFASMFMIESDGSLKSFGLSIFRAFKMCIYNYPFCLISLILLHYLSQGWDMLIFGLFQYFQVPIVEFFDDSLLILPIFRIIKYATILFWPIPLCYLINFYIKRLHEQFDLYFPR